MIQGRVSISDSLLKRFLNGERAALAKLITLLENESEAGISVYNAVYPRIGKAHRIGITGPPGAGKSTLVEKMVLEFRRMEKSVAVVAVDPTSPFSGGAILGDRIRMSSLFCDPGVFIRSMATRGSLGGLALKTKEVCDLLDAFGKDFIIIETVGVGQAELDVAKAAHTTIIVLVPESGDGIQAMKAGLMEIGDLFVVNKSDRDGSERMIAEIEMMLEMKPESDWRTPVISTIAVEDRGIERLTKAIHAHWELLNQNDRLLAIHEQNIRSDIEHLVNRRIAREIWDNSRIQSAFESVVQKVIKGELSPIEAASELLSAWHSER